MHPIDADRASPEAKLREKRLFLQKADECSHTNLVSRSWELRRAEHEAWENKVRRADLTARLNDRDRWIESVEHSWAWKIAKPLWKLQRRFSKHVAGSIGELSDLVYALDCPDGWNPSNGVLTISGWCFAHGGPQVVGVRARVGRKSYFGHYGLIREDVAQKVPDYPGARYGGFSINITLSPGTSTVRLEAIGQGTSWKCFVERALEITAEDGSTAAREVSSEDARSGRISATDKRYGHQLPIVYPSVRANEVVSVLRPLIVHHAGRVKSKLPLISIVTCTFNTRPRWLAEAAASVLNQTFADWEWCLSDAGSDNPEVGEMLQSLGKAHDAFKVSFATRASVSAARNRALELARGEFVCFLDHDALLHPEALAAMAGKLREGFDVGYSDEDKFDDASGLLTEPFFKPAWSPEYFRGAIYVGHLLCLRRELAASVGFDPALDGVQDFAFMLRVSETDARITHIPRVLYHKRKIVRSIGAASDRKADLMTLEPKALSAHLERMGLPARAESGATPHRLKIVPTPRKSFPKISIMIPTKDSPELLSRCLNGLYQNTRYPNFEVILADNNTTNKEALEVMRAYPAVRIEIPNPFNFSRANNTAVRHAAGEYLVFLNNDTEIISELWLDHLVYYAEQEDVGAVGALLLHEDGGVQHAGVVLGMRGTADHMMRGFTVNSDGYGGNLSCPREVSAVTAACMAMRKLTFEAIGGFDEDFRNVYQDLDLCLRLRSRGLRIIWTPRVLLIHHESHSRQKSDDLVDRQLLLDRWRAVIEQGDPYYNPNLNVERGDYSWRT